MPNTDGLRQIWVGRETTEGTAPTYMRMIPCSSYKPTLKDQRITPKEYQGTRIRQLNTTRAMKHGEVDFTVYARYDLLGYLLSGILHNPTTTATGAVTSNVQTLNFTGTWANADTFTITVDGYTTASISYNTTAATFRTSLVSALTLLPSLGSASNTTTGNLQVGLPSGTTTNTVALTFQNTLSGANMPLITMTVVSSTAGTVAATTNTTPGVGAYSHVFLAGAASVPTLTIIDYDGLQYYTRSGVGLTSMDLDFSLTDCVKCSFKGIGKFETKAASKPAACADAVNAAYNHPIDPASLTLTHLGGSYTVAKGGKISVKQPRQNIHALGTGSTDSIRVTEGESETSFDLTSRLIATSATAYDKFIANTTPTSLSVIGTDTTAIGAASVPTCTINIPKPWFEDGQREFAPDNEPTQTLKGAALYDTTTGTNLKITLLNEIKTYATPIS